MTHTLLDNNPTFLDSPDGVLIRHDQVITGEFLDSLHSERLAKATMRSREFNRVASVPTSVVELWLRQGRDFWNATPHEVVAWLVADGLDAFVTTPKRV